MQLTGRPHQINGVIAIRDHIAAGRRRVIALSPTGSGKTWLGTDVARRVVERKGSLLWVTHRIELIEQASSRLDELELDHGVIQGSHSRTRLGLPIQVASVQTLARREALPPATVIVIDECHHATSTGYVSLLSRYRDAYVIGLTATAERLDGSGLGTTGPLGAMGFQAIVEVARIDELVALGYLVPSVVYAPTVPDLHDVQTLGGEYNSKQLAGVMDRPAITGDIVATWLRLAKGQTTVGFAVNCDHGRHLTERCVAAGIAAEFLDFKTPPLERKAVLARVASGETTWLWNVDLMTEGWDMPRASVIVWARPTASLCLYLQGCGRGLRPWEGKTRCLVLDHAGNVHRHGFPNEHHTYSLDSKRRKIAGVLPLSLRTCLQCFAVSRGTSANCELCGAAFPVRKQEIRHEDGELQEVTPAQMWAARAGDDARVKSLAKWMREGKDRGYKPTWPLVRYRALFHQWPGPDVQRKAEEMTHE